MPNVFQRIQVACGLLLGLGIHDFRAARTWMNTMYPGVTPPTKLYRFLCWSLKTMLSDIPAAMPFASWQKPIKKTAFWLDDANPHANYPWRDHPQVTLPETCHLVVIGAGFTGAAAAYHWSQNAQDDKKMVVLEMNEVASGSSGRNEGLVVMGRYYAMVHNFMLTDLKKTRPDLTADQQDKLARQFAAAYCNATYKSADMIADIIQKEGFDCDYVRSGWITALKREDQPALDKAVMMARQSGFTDWTRLAPDLVKNKSGMQVKYDAAFSQKAASIHPAKWVWSLISAALKSNTVELYTRTQVLKIQDDGSEYIVHTNRGTLRAQYVINATEAYSAKLHPQLRNIVRCHQTQGVFAQQGPSAMKPHIGLSSNRAFFGRHGDGMMFGSDATRIPDKQAGRSDPSRFITKFLLGEIASWFGPYRCRITHEWTGSVGFTADQFPVVGLMDGKKQFIIAGMAGSGSAVSFNAARCICNRILGKVEDEDYPEEYFSPSRLLDPANHKWPEIDA